PPGAQRLELQRRDGLAVGGVIRLGTGPEREYVTVESLIGPADLTLQGAVTLRVPLAHGHRRADLPPPRRPALGPVGAGTPLTRRACPGDQAIVVNDATLFLADATFVVNDATVARREFRVASPLADTSDADGYYRIGPIGRTPTVTVRVTPPAAPPEP